jgi:hypothetical protein
MIITEILLDKVCLNVSKNKDGRQVFKYKVIFLDKKKNLGGCYGTKMLLVET